MKIPTNRHLLSSSIPTKISRFSNKLAFLILTSLLLLNLSSSAAGQTDSSAQVGDRIQTLDQTPVWSNPPLRGRFGGTQEANTAGSISDGPVRAGEVSWWKIHFDNGGEGWIADRKFRDLSGRSRGPRPTPTRPPTAAQPSFVYLFPPNGSFVDFSRITARGILSGDIYAPPLISLSVGGSNITVDSRGTIFAPAYSPTRTKYADLSSNYSEDHVAGAGVGPIIRRNTTITKLQDNVFPFDASTLASLPVKSGSLPAGSD